MPTGRVKIFNTERGFGFVTATDGEELLFRRDALDADQVRSGDMVEFEVADGDDRNRTVASLTVVKAAIRRTMPSGSRTSSRAPWSAKNSTTGSVSQEQVSCSSRTIRSDCLAC